MNIMVISDDHGMPGFAEAFELMKRKTGKIDAVFHAGDTQGFDKAYYEAICQCPVYIVRGNNDYNDMPYDLFVEIGGKRIFMTHGHNYGVYGDKQRVYYAGKQRNADVVIFGHTHVPEHIKLPDMDLLNPGSLTLPRRGRCGCCANLLIDGADVLITHFTLV